VILTLAWKEYREHRSIWLTMVLLTGVLALGLDRFAALWQGSAVSQVGVAILGMAGAYGVVCGAMMFAGEREGLPPGCPRSSAWGAGAALPR
jgi:hypothetical protein